MAAKKRVAVIGRTGRGDYGHGIDVVWLEVPDVEIVAVADDDKMGLAAAVKRLGAPQGYSDWREMLDREKPDIVSICQRWVDQHCDMVLAAAERGIHMLIEKPLCRTLEEADRMVDACQRTHTRLAIAHQTRYSPRIEVARKLVAEGRIGRVLEFRGRGKEDQRGGGEDLFVLGSHIMDLIRLFGGDPQWCFAEVMNKEHVITAADVVEGNEGIGPLAGDSVAAMYGMPDGATAYFGSQRGAAGSRPRFGLRILGTTGAIEMATGYLPSVRLLEDSSWASHPPQTAWQEITSAGVGEPEPLADGAAHAANLLIAADLLHAIEENREPKGGIKEARGTIEMIMAVFESQRVGGRVAMPITNRANPLTMLG
jgi:predicted dehydrogenase